MKYALPAILVAMLGAACTKAPGTPTEIPAAGVPPAVETETPAAPQARKLVFVTSSQDRVHSIAVVDDHAGFSSTFFGDEADRTSFPEYHVGMTLDVYCGDKRIGQLEVREIHLTFGSYGDVDHATVSPAKPLDTVPPDCFATNYPLAQTLAVAYEDPIDRRIREGVEAHLRERLEPAALVPEVVDQVVSSCVHRQLYWNARRPSLVVATCDFASRVLGEDGFSLIALLEVDPTGESRLAYFDGYRASPYAYGEAADDYFHGGGHAFLDVADLDGDGLPEIAVWESASQSLELLSLKGSDWRKVATSRPGYITH